MWPHASPRHNVPDVIMKRIAIIGAGVSGLTMGRLLAPRASVTVFESASRPGGLIKCDRVEGNLFHTCGGHVFNTRRPGVLDLFWSIFDRDRDFVKADRNSAVRMPDGAEIPYPIENHAYMLDDDTLRSVIADVAGMRSSGSVPANFEEFLRKQFGDTLYNLYFGPYNRKVWRRDLSDVPLSWLEGKLPMPTPEEILFNNIRRVKEKAFVHSTFYYERQGGSQFIADTLAQGLDIRYSSPVSRLEKAAGEGWLVDGEPFDRVVFCGNIKDLPAMLAGVDMSGFLQGIERLESHGTTAVFCDIAPNPYSWIYLPDPRYDAHRIICTGNFSRTNNAPGRMTATIEFTDSISRDEILRQLPSIPFSPRYITHCYNPYTYPIQHTDTRAMISELCRRLAPSGMYLTGRFALWEYFNMDVAMDSALALAPTVSASL